MAISTDLYRELHTDQYRAMSAIGQGMNGPSNLQELQMAQMDPKRYYEEMKRQQYAQQAQLRAPALLSKIPNLLLLCEDI